MEAACHVRVVNERNELVVRAAFEVAVALSKVDVDLDFML